ncbi:GNAT family N-acetyltransferase [Spartinivicinus ruber]|uniref:GNAT family N-acetyltransferase n=1 Tax=Spartinivicinus ruber TaxID=2683272 RepID=UPI0013D734DA|nr:GNAT family N-acetyltransferase [Spartinivicinus ruber]
MSLLAKWQTRHWQPLTAGQYEEAYQQWGGSFITHPEVIGVVSSLLDIPLEFSGRYQDGQLIAAIPVWENYVAGSKQALKKLGKRGLVDTGNAEIILPIAENAQLELPYKAELISNLHEPQLTNLKDKDKQICLAKGFQPGGYSKKFKYNHRRELRLFQEAGGELHPISELSADQICEFYLTLFELRWGFAAKGTSLMGELLSRLQNYLVGSVLYFDKRPVAIQLVYQAESEKWLSVEYINGGVDPSVKEFSPGSMLSFLNVQEAQEAADKQNKQLRYSFGLADNEYKDRWCSRVSVYST